MIYQLPRAYQTTVIVIFVSVFGIFKGVMLSASLHHFVAGIGYIDFGLRKLSADMEHSCKYVE
jgi:hypothetical protein